MQTVTTVGSPRIARFEEDARHDASQARDALIQELRTAAGPLIEITPGGTLVTFVYIGPGERVMLGSEIARVDELRVPMTNVNGTDVWYVAVPVPEPDMCASYTFLVDQPELDVDLSRDLADENAFKAILVNLFQHSVPDPYNPDRLCLPIGYHFKDGEGPQEFVRSVFTLPGAERHEWLAPAPAADTFVRELDLRSSVFDNTRRVSVYVPPQYNAQDDDHAVVYFNDGEMNLKSGFHHVLHRLMNDGQIPPTAAVFIHNADSYSRMVELTCHPALPDFMATDVVPFVEEAFGVGSNAKRTVISGASLGGLSSLWIAYERPQMFGNVLSMSGSFWWGQQDKYGERVNRDDDEAHDLQPEWLSRLIARSAARDITIWLDAGTLECTTPIPNRPSLLESNRRLNEILTTKGYKVRYREYSGGHDPAGWRRTFGEGIQFLLGPATRVSAAAGSDVTAS